MENGTIKLSELTPADISHVHIERLANSDQHQAFIHLTDGRPVMLIDIEDETQIRHELPDFAFALWERRSLGIIPIAKQTEIRAIESPASDIITTPGMAY